MTANTNTYPFTIDLDDWYADDDIIVEANDAGVCEFSEPEANRDAPRQWERTAMIATGLLVALTAMVAPLL